jgi:hypothetical protein
MPAHTQQRRLRKLFKAVRTGERSRVLYRLYRANVDVNGVGDGTGCTPLHEACALPPPSSFEVAKVLIEHGARIGARNRHGVTPLHCAVRCATAAMATRRKATGGGASGTCRRDLADEDDLADDAVAATTAAIALCALLVSKGADSLATDEDGMCPEALGLGELLDAHVERSACNEQTHEDAAGGKRARQEWDERIRDEHEAGYHEERSFGFGDGWRAEERAHDRRVEEDASGDWFEHVAREHHSKRYKRGSSPAPRAADNRHEAPPFVPASATTSSTAGGSAAPKHSGAAEHSGTAAAAADAAAAACEHRRAREEQLRQNGRNADERRWEEFRARCAPGHTIEFQDIPWPSGPPHNLLHLELDTEGKQNPSGTKATADIKATIRSAWLRWHPDKFMQKFATLLDVSDREKIVERLNAITKHINSVKV